MMTLERPAAQPAPTGTFPPTHIDALGHARYVYRYITTRALEVAGDERAIVQELAADWDARLTSVYTTPEPMSPDELTVLDRLVSAAMHRDLSRAAAIEWVDAFPSAVLRLLGTSAVEMDQDVENWVDVPADEADARTAANKQSTLALAA